MLSTFSPSSRKLKVVSWCSNSCDKQDLWLLNPCCDWFSFLCTSRWLTMDFLIILSIVFMIWEVRDTGRKFAGEDLSPPLWTGITNASFRMEGIVPVERKVLNRISSGSARLLLQFFRRIAGTPSGPAAD